MMFKMAIRALRRHLRDGHEPTIEELLSDPIVQAVMEADHISPAALKAELQNLAAARSKPELKNGGM